MNVHGIRPMHYMALFTYVLLNIIDVAMTYYALTLPGVYELNPYFGNLTTMIKLVATFSLCGIWIFTRKRAVKENCKLACVILDLALFFGFTFYIILTFNNSITMLRALGVGV